MSIIPTRGRGMGEYSYMTDLSGQASEKKPGPKWVGGGGGCLNTPAYCVLNDLKLC